MGQRAGDPIGMADGFDDRAYIYQFLDGEHASFVSGDIGRLYWGKVKSLRRNVLYLKPRVVLMLDTVVPSERDVDVTLLYQAINLDDIEAGNKMSRINKDTAVMNILHLHPQHVAAEAREVPHYIWTVTNRSGDNDHLEREGMLAVTATTDRSPLVFANLLTSTVDGEPDVDTKRFDGCIGGAVDGIPFVFSTSVGNPYVYNGLKTDALAVTYDDNALFAALCTLLENDGKTVLASTEPITCEVNQGTVRYCLADKSEVTIGVASRPGSVTITDCTTNKTRKITNHRELHYNSETATITLSLPEGEGVISIQ